MPYYIHKHEVWQESGGPEEGGWWYHAGQPAEDYNVHAHRFFNRGDAVVECIKLNQQETARADEEETYSYSSVLSYRSTHYEYSVHETPVMKHFPETKPHYE